MQTWKGRVAAFFGIIAFVGYLSLSWAGAGWLLMPPRKPAPLWASGMIAKGGSDGLHVASGVTESGVPYLICTPDAASDPSSRGKILRAQLVAAGSPLGKFGEIHGTLVLLHGWGMRKENLLVTAERFCAAGFRCLIPDLPGHGENSAPLARFGQCEGERMLPRNVLESAARKFRFRSRPAALWGMSMGGACAIQAAAGTPECWDSLVIVSSFDGLDSVVSGALEREVGGLAAAVLHPGLSVAVWLRGGFRLGSAEPLESAGRLRGSTFIVHGAADDLIPLPAGQRLYRVVPAGRKRWLEVSDARHGNVLGTPQHVFAEMAAWLLRESTTTPARGTSGFAHAIGER